MDLDDSFTDKLLKRTKARKDYLKGKMMESPARKKRTALVDEQQIPNEDNKELKESPKRLCVEQMDSEREVKENVSVKRKEKKGNDCMKEDEPLEVTRSAQDGLNERKVSQVTQVDKPLSCVFSTNSRELCSTRNRLACLAADINSWEDNLTRSAVPATSSAKEAAAAKEVEDTLNQSFEPSSLPLSARRALFEQAAMENKVQSEKKVFEPKVSVARRAAMFENAPKNKFRFRTAHQKPADALDPAKPSAVLKGRPSAAVTRSPAKPSSISSTGSPSKPSPALTRSPAKPSIALTRSSTKPSIASTGSPAKPSPALTRSPAKSSIASTRSPGIPSPALTKSSAKPSIASTGSAVRSSPAFSRNSPAKPGGGTTTPTKSFIPKPIKVSIQQQWAKTDGMGPEKKRPLSRLVHHWEKLASSSSVINRQSEEEVPSYALAAREESSYSSEEEQMGPECEEEQTESEQEEQQVQSECEEPSECEESKSDSTPDEEESGDDDYPYTDASSFNSKKFAAAAGIETETESEDRNSLPDHYSANPVSDGISCYPSPSLSSSPCGTTDREDQSSHQPLLHTVSAYRKLIKESGTPPVRRRRVPPFTEEEQGRITDNRETIKHLQEEVVRQQNRIGQSSKLINWLISTKPGFHGSTDEVEAEKVLLIASQKHQACLNEIHRLKFHGAQGGVAEDGYGTLTITNMELPLKRDFIAAQLEGKTTDIHYFLCLLRRGAQVIETQMVSTIDKISDGSLHFTNLIKLKNLPPDFSIVFEVFTLQIKKESPSGLKRDHSKIKLAPKKKKENGKLPAVSSPGGPLAVRSPSFRAVGYTYLNLQNCIEECLTLDKIPFTSPLEGVLKVKLQLHAEHNVTEKGFLTMFEDVSGFGAWHRRWCSLENHLLSYWKYPDDEENKKDAIGSIDLRQCITKEVHSVSRDICARPNTFQLVEVRPRKKSDRDTLISHCHGTLTTTKRLLSADTHDELKRWCQKLNETLHYVRLWVPKAPTPTR